MLFFQAPDAIFILLFFSLTTTNEKIFYCAIYGTVREDVIGKLSCHETIFREKFAGEDTTERYILFIAKYLITNEEATD